MKPGAEIQLAQRQANDELVDYVEKEQPCDFLELREFFGGPDGGTRAKVIFQKRLAYLVSKGRLKTVNLAGKLHWEVPELGTAGEADCKPAEKITRCADNWVGAVVPPRQHNVMDGPTYVPEPDASLRAGALDYRRVASHGVRC
jgi:hypothetical protein